MTDLTPLLSVDDVHVDYEGIISALRGVSLDVRRGEIVALLGSNGAGKTTTLKAASGLLEAERGAITRGSIRFADLPRRLDPRGLARAGLVQVLEGRRCFSHLSVHENLLSGTLVRRLRRGEAEADLEQVYALFPRLKERVASSAGFLSGGEQQMLAIGRALMNRPTLLLLDEPSLGLSPILVKEIFTIIKRVNEEQGMSILLVEQNAKIALETAHYGYVLEIGRVVMNDTCERLMNSKDIQEFYLGAKEEGARGERRWKKKKTWR